MKKRAILVAALFLFPAIMLAQSINENEMFSSEESVVEASTVTVSNLTGEIDSDRTSFSGTIYSRTTYSMPKKWLEGRTNSKANSLFTYLEGNINLDIRLKKDIKAYVNLDAYYSPQGQVNWKDYTQYRNDGTSTNLRLMETVNTVVNFKEFFLSGNFSRKVYFILGKQVLQWGRGYFWQPTDLINIDRKDFFNLDNQVREGNFGLKLHVPFGTRANVYGFLDMNKADGFDEMGTAGKVEILLGRTELALSAMQKKNLFPVYGFDLSSRLFGWDIWGEAAYSKGDNRMRLKRTNIPFFGDTFVVYREREKSVIRACGGLSRSFDCVIPDRIMVTAEFMYNSEGYTENYFNAGLDPFTRFIFPQTYRMNEYSPYYVALFTSFKKVFISDLSWSMNALMNIDQLSFTAGTGLMWAVVDKCTMGLNVYGFFGPANTEYTYSGAGMVGDMTLSVRF